MSGYMHSDYGKSLGEFGIPCRLPRCGGWILKRQIPGFSCLDGMGVYPLFFCRDWSQLHTDLDEIGKDLVSLTVVADPFGAYTLRLLQKSFDVVIPFKKHFIVNLIQPLDGIVSRHHAKCARTALRKMTVEVCAHPEQVLGQWVGLYNHLIQRHELKGIQAFSEVSFRKQLTIPGTVLFQAIHQDRTIGMDWYFKQKDVVYAHLAAFNPVCYRLMGSYALQWSAIEYFSGRCQYLNLGAGPGIYSNGTDGLSLWKRGWSTGTRTSYLCGKVFDQNRYREIVNAKNISGTGYFPAYRKGEFQ